MIIEHFLIKENEQYAVIIVVDKKTYDKAPMFEMDIYDDYNNEYPVEIEAVHLLEYMAEEFDIIVFEEGNEQIEELRGFKID